MASDYQITEFYSSLTEYGYSDVKTAIEKFEEVGMSASDLAEKVRECHEYNGIPIQDIDVCYVAYDHILQTARNKIDEILDFDICDDIKDGTGFYTAGNFMCTSFDYSQEVKDQLKEKLKDAETEQIKKLLDDIFVKVFLEDVEINIEEIRKTGSEKQEVANMNLFIKTHGTYADYSDVLDFTMRETAFTIDSFIAESYTSGVLLLDQDCLLEIV